MPKDPTSWTFTHILKAKSSSKAKAIKHNHNDLLSKTASLLRINSIISSRKSTNTMKSWKWSRPISMMLHKINNSLQIFTLNILSTPLMNLISRKRLYFPLTPKWERLSQTYKRQTRFSKIRLKDGLSSSLKQQDFLKLCCPKTKFLERPFVQKISNFWNLSKRFPTLKIIKSLKWKKTCKFQDKKMESCWTTCKKWKKFKRKNYKMKKDWRTHTNKNEIKWLKSKRKIHKSKTKNNTYPKQ